jgi:osmoprotectant transport system ATP-binding protein
VDVLGSPAPRCILKQPALAARNLTKRYPNGVQALVDLDPDIHSGETVALIGESGCGKSTLLRMFNRLESPSSGLILVAGVDAAHIDPIALRRATGYVQQDGGLLPHWSVERNVELVPALLGWSLERRRQLTSELLDLVGLEARTFARRYPHELSGGQQQRVAFARALAADPDVILLDEPFGALDAITRAQLQQEFLRLKNRLGKTMLLVTHDLREAELLGDRVAVLRQGRLLQCDTPDRLHGAPADAYVALLLRHARTSSGDAS